MRVAQSTSPRDDRKVNMGKIATIDESIESLAEALREIATRLRPLMDKEFPQATGKMWHGHPV